jgi:hypothetical protein
MMGYKKDIKTARRAIVELLRELREYERAGDWEQVMNNARSIHNWAYEIETLAASKNLGDD